MTAFRVFLSRLKGLLGGGRADAALDEDIEAHLAFLKARRATLDKELLTAVTADIDWNRKAKLLKSVPGVGPVLCVTLLAELPELSSEQIDRYIAAGVVVPVQSDHGPLFRDIDLARLHLVADLAEGYHLDEEALNLVLSLVDQLHGLRGDMRAILDALAREPVETRVRLKTAIREVRLMVRG